MDYVFTTNVNNNDPILNPPAIVQSINKDKTEYSFPKNYKNLKDKVLCTIISHRKIKTKIADDIIFEHGFTLSEKQEYLRELQEDRKNEFDKKIKFITNLENTLRGRELKRIRKTKQETITKFNKDFLTINDAYDLTLLQETSNATNTPSRPSTSSNYSYDSNESQHVVMNEELATHFSDINF